MSRPGTKKKNSSGGAAAGIDWMLVIIVIALSVFGLVMIYSASSYTAVTEGRPATFYVKKQFISMLVGIAGMLICAFLPLKFWRVLSPVIFLISAVAIGLVKTSLGIAKGDVRRWLDLKVTTLQPSELMKIGLILLLALLLARFGDDIGEVKQFVISYAVVLFAVGLIVLITDDLGTAIVVFVIGIAMIFAAGPNKKHFLITLAGSAAIVIIFIVTKSYRMDRIRAWLKPYDYESSLAYQPLQALYAIGSGGLVGKGLGKSTQKLGFVPESQNDMIFSIICEEMGVVGAIIMIALFALLIVQIKRVCDETKEPFDRFVAIGIMTHIAAQTFVNLAVVTSIIPNTGVPLPFISYGGTSLMMLMAEMGIVLAIKHKAAQSPEKRRVIKEDKSRGVIYYPR